MALGASHRLHNGVAAVETMTRFALAVLALASGVYTYLGVRSILDGSPTAVFFAAIIYSGSVSVAIYAFWSYMARFFPHVTGPSARGAMIGIMALGCAMIIAMSSWLNAAALAGSAALEQHLAETVEGYTATRRTRMRSPRKACCPISSAPPNGFRNWPTRSASPAR